MARAALDKFDSVKPQSDQWPEESLNCAMLQAMQQMLADHPALGERFQAISLGAKGAAGSTLRFATREHRIDNVILWHGGVVCWNDVVVVMEGKPSLLNLDNTLSAKGYEAVGQCLQRQHIILRSTSTLRAVTWGAYYDAEYMGFVRVVRPSDSDSEGEAENFVKIVLPMPIAEGFDFLCSLLLNESILAYKRDSLTVNGSPVFILDNKHHSRFVGAALKPRDSGEHITVDHYQWVLKGNQLLEEVQTEYDVLQILHRGSVPNVANLKLNDGVFEVLFAEKHYYAFWMEWAGESLVSCGKRSDNNQVDDGRLALYADGLKSLTVALEALHAAGYVHRDITPLNIVVRESRCTLVDFGEAARIDYSLVSPLDFVGTRMWASRRRQIGSCPRAIPLDDWESLFLTFIDVGNCGQHFEFCISWDNPNEWGKLAMFNEDTINDVLKTISAAGGAALVTELEAVWNRIRELQRPEDL